MASFRIERAASAQPVTLTEAKNFLRVSIDDDDALINVLIDAATAACETFTNRSFCRKGYLQTLDSFPYYVDNIMSQQAYPPSYYSQPMYSTTLWNYSQMIKLFAPPLVSVDRISFLSSADSQWHDLTPIPSLWYPAKVYVLNDKVMDNNGNVQKCSVAGTSQSDPPNPWNTELGGTTVETTDSPDEADGPTWTNMGPAFLTGGLNQPSTSASGQFGSYILDTQGEPGRIFPGPPGNNWPPVLYVPDAVQIHLTAGYAVDGSDVGVGPGQMPGQVKIAILQCLANWYENREAAMMGQWGELPNHCKMLLWSIKVQDYAPTRG